jgi:hypothetical protein
VRHWLEVETQMHGGSQKHGDKQMDRSSWPPLLEMSGLSSSDCSKGHRVRQFPNAVVLEQANADFFDWRELEILQRAKALAKLCQGQMPETSCQRGQRNLPSSITGSHLQCANDEIYYYRRR